MDKKGPDFIDRFADGLTTAATRMKAIEATPEHKQKRHMARVQVACIILIGLPASMLAVIVSQRLGWPKLIYFPIALVAFGGSKLLGAVIAKRYQGSSSVSN